MPQEQFSWVLFVVELVPVSKVMMALSLCVMSQALSPLCYQGEYQTVTPSHVLLLYTKEL